MGWTMKQGVGVTLDAEAALLRTELAHLVDSGEWKWIQYLTNKLEEKAFLEVDNLNIIEIKDKLKKMHLAHNEEMYKADDNDAAYYTPDNFDTATQQSELWEVSLYVIDSAANVLSLNSRAHGMLFDNLMKTAGSPNMSADKKHEFFTVDTTGQVHGIAKRTTNDGEFMGYLKKDDTFYPCGVGNSSKVNSYWYDCSDASFQSDRVQWLQNYRRKRWTQIRNLCYGFMLEANVDEDIDLNSNSNICDTKKGCGYVQPKAVNTWTSEYNKEYQHYQYGQLHSSLASMTLNTPTF